MRSPGPLFALILVLASFPASALAPLQLFIDLTPPGGTLKPPPGVYAGPVVISRPLTLDGGGAVTIDGEATGTILTVRADNAVVRGVNLTNSGDSHNDMDAGILLTANDVLIEENTIEQTLFGIVVNQGRNNVLRNNRISSRGQIPSLRGEGIRLWYSEGNRIENNRIENVRDTVLTNSSNNLITGNLILNSRIAMELVFSPNNRVVNNVIRRNKNGVVNLYSDRNLIKANRIEDMRGPTHSALAVKESYRVRIEENEILNCGIGITANTPTHPENILYLTGNRFGYNDIAIYFYGERGGHVIYGNRFEQNLMHVAVSAPTSARDNEWRGNFWDDYEGFDLDADGVGDLPYSSYLYADRVWMDRPMTRFFRSSPVLELIDFVERLAPFSEPDLIVFDPTPRVR